MARHPGGLPSLLQERRPDIAAAERRVAAANEQIGIARRLLSDRDAERVGRVRGQHLRRRRATSDASLAAYDATVASYRQTTLTAFQQVEDNLAVLRILDQEAQQQRRAVESARESLRLFINRYQGGVDNYLQVITAQTVTLTNQRNEIDILRRRI